MAPGLPPTTSTRLPPSPATSRTIAVKVATAAAAAAVAASAASLALTAKSAGRPLAHYASPAPLFAECAQIFDRSISLDPRIRTPFRDARSVDECLLHVGLLEKKGHFFRSSKVYAFGVYADTNDLKQQMEYYKKLSLSELMQKAELINDVLDRDIGITVRLMTVVDSDTSLSLPEVGQEIATLVESRLRKVDGVSSALLKRFVSFVKDENILLKGSMIELSRKRNHVLKISIDDKEMGSIKDRLLCKLILHLYVGDDPLDKMAKHNILEEIARLLAFGLNGSGM